MMNPAPIWQVVGRLAARQRRPSPTLLTTRAWACQDTIRIAGYYQDISGIRIGFRNTKNTKYTIQNTE